MNQESDIANKLRKYNLSVTDTRLRLLGAISDYQGAIPYTEIKRSLPDCNRITIYRNLNTFIEKGIVHRALNDVENSYYAICGSNCKEGGHSHQHIHFKCTACHSVECIEDSKFQLAGLSGLQVHSVNVEVDGLCRDCS